MQMKIVVDTPEDYKKWVINQTNVITQVKTAAAEPAVEGATGSGDSTKVNDTAAVVKMAMK
jgi:cytochrome c oxidase subunit 2